MVLEKLSGCSVLLVDDEQVILLPLRDSLRDAGAEVVCAATGDQAAELVAARPFDVVVSDVRMPGLNGLELLDRIKRQGVETQVILMTAFANVEHAVAAIKAGAFDYVLKPFPDERLVHVIAHVWAMARLRREVTELRSRAGIEGDLGFLVGTSDAWRRVVDRIRMVAPTDSTVLVVGQSGTGKELVARAIHRASQRARAPFVRVHCAALPPTLMESELFGHVKGAFTGATGEVRGRFELAHGGTLLLDEVDEIPLELQVKLLRVIQERTIERLGSGTPIPVDVRIVATTKARLEERVAAQRFRQDLLYRLSVVQLNLPLLRDRGPDIPLLLEHFLRIFSQRLQRPGLTFDRPALAALLAYDYPGNVRELEHIVEAACATSTGASLGVELLPETVRDNAGGSRVRVGMEIRPLAAVLDEFERSYLEHALREFSGSRSELAHALGISRKGLWQKLKRHGLANGDDG